MAAYTQFGCGYPSANQFLSSNSLTTLTNPTVQSPIAATSIAPSLSPPSVGAESSTSSGDGAGTHSDTLTPDPTSQSSATCVSSSATTNTIDSGTAAYACAVNVNTTTAAPPCCDNGRTIIPDSVAGQSFCSYQYDPTRLALSSYGRIQSAAGVGVYNTAYPSTEQNPYPSIGVETAPFYSTLSNPYALKDSSNSADVTAWTSASLQPSAGYYTYDPTFGAYSYGASYDLAARRKNATRESTATLKAWLNEHKKNPYPTKGEKIMLAIITKMTLTQVSTWFANARRRLKKENKMTWEPKHRTEDDDDVLASDEEKDREDNESEKRQSFGANIGTNSSVAGVELAASATHPTNVGVVGGIVGSHNTGTSVGGVPGAQPKGYYELNQQSSYSTTNNPSRQMTDKFQEQANYFMVHSGVTQIKNEDYNDERPKIWSLADTAAETKTTMQYASRNDWPTNYGQHYNTGGQTSIMATISMQPTSPTTTPATGHLYAPAVTPPNTPPNHNTLLPIASNKILNAKFSKTETEGHEAGVSPACFRSQYCT